MDALHAKYSRLSRRRAMTRIGAGGAGLVLAGRHWPASAQEATPPAGIVAIELAPGVTAEIFAGVPTARPAGQTLTRLACPADALVIDASLQEGEYHGRYLLR